MREVHGPAEKLFVDFAGDTVPVFGPATGVQRLAHVFVAVLGASNYTFAEARWSEGLADWIGLYADERPPDGPPIRHRNIRGTDYYH